MDEDNTFYLRPRLIGDPVNGDGVRGSRIDVVVPLWNEETLLGELHDRLIAACEQTDTCYRIIYVDDGSHDTTGAQLRRLASNNPAVSVVFLSRNFGQPLAIAAGMKEADADAVILLDGDLQDPPELIPQMVAAWRESAASVVIAKRTAREESGIVRRVLFGAFHRFFSGLSEIDIPSNTGTFCLMSRRVVDVIMSLPESHRFFPGLRTWAGFETTFVEYARPERGGGESPRQTLSRLIRYAGDAVFGFSAKPVVWILYACMTAMLLTACGLLASIALSVFGANAITIGFGLLITAVFLCLTVQLAATAFVAELMRRVHEQSKHRPLFVVAEQLNCRSDSRVSPAEAPSTAPASSSSLSRWEKLA